VRAALRHGFANCLAFFFWRLTTAAAFDCAGLQALDCNNSDLAASAHSGHAPAIDANDLPVMEL
jgi:hypothetical protein